MLSQLYLKSYRPNDHQLCNSENEAVHETSYAGGGMTFHELHQWQTTAWAIESRGLASYLLEFSQRIQQK